jgi:Tfp pilus assembly protein PilN
MPNINLIAARRQEHKRIEKASRWLFIGLISSIGVVGVLGMYLASHNFMLNNEKRDLEVSLGKLKPVLDEIKSLEDQRDQMAPRVETLEVAQMETLRWCAYLQTIADAIPRGAWLNSMNATLKNPEDAALIKLTGVADSHARISETLMNLNGKAPILQNASLKDERGLPATNGQDVSGKTFTIEVNLASVVLPPPPVKDTKKEKTSGTS